MKWFSICIFFLLSLPAYAFASDGDCASWPENMAETWLKNKHIVDISQLNPAQTKISLLASEKKANGVNTDIYHFVFFDRKGNKYEVITRSDSSQEECSMSEVDIFLISQTDQKN